MTSGFSMHAIIRTAPRQAGPVSSGTSLCRTASRQPTSVQIGGPADSSISVANTRFNAAPRARTPDLSPARRGAAFRWRGRLRIRVSGMPASPAPPRQGHSGAVLEAGKLVTVHLNGGETDMNR